MIAHVSEGGFLYLLLLLCGITKATNRYYGTYLSYGTGDTFVETAHSHGGPKTAYRKWNVECLDGEAMIGIRDWIDDFQRIVRVWCKYTFPYKPATSGLYPYYPNCHVRNLTISFFCFDPTEVALTVNGFVTGFYDTDYQFRVDRIVVDETNVYKCCKTPLGYAIDYTSCLYKPTRDQYWEYYDAPNFLVMCDTGYLMTGMAKKVNPYDTEYHVEWIQCCRVGFDIATLGTDRILPVLAGTAPLLGKPYSSADSNGYAPLLG